MKKLSFLFLGLSLVSCVESKEPPTPDQSLLAEKEPNSEAQISTEKEEINKLLDQWHRAAGEADFNEYFGAMAENSIYIGTDATENWNLEQFKEFSKPYFDRGKAWDFTPIARNIYFSDSGATAWFDELLDTHMGICRGSGILTLDNGEWEIQHYVLSVTVPNEQVEEVTELKREIDSGLVVMPELRGAL